MKRVDWNTDRQGNETMAHDWTTDDWNRFNEAVDAKNFDGYDKDTVLAAALDNAVDVAAEDDPVGCAISTMDLYLDDWDMYLGLLTDYEQDLARENRELRVGACKS